MGTLVYGSPGELYSVEDRTLVHLQIVIVAKLRRGERFTYRHDGGETAGHSTEFWMSPEIPLRFVYSDAATGSINSTWLKMLAATAYHHAGLRLVPEPDTGSAPVA